MPILLTQDEWARIVKWTDAEREDPETARRREYVAFLNDASREMTKSWPNSLENVNKRNEEVRRARLDAAEQANTKFYKRYVKRQKEQEQRLMYSARDTIFKNKDAPKLLLSAVIETVILKERDEQCKFNAKLRAMGVEAKRKEEEEIILKAREWHDLNKLRLQRRFEVNKKHQKEIVDQAHEYSERLRKEHEDEVNRQTVDNVMAQKEIKDIKEFEEEFKVAEKARIWSDMQRSREETEQRRREQAELDRMDERLQDVLLGSRARVERRRKVTEKAEREEKLRILDAISQKLESGEAARDAKEQASLEKAVREREANEEARRQAQLRKEEQFRKERIESREQFLRDEAQRTHELHTTRQWELMNRFKNEEIYDDFKEMKRQERESKIKEYRAEILRLIKERENREDRERAETRYFYGELALKKLRDADNKLLTHAGALLAEARANGRPDHALHKAINRYCNLYRLYPMPDMPKSLQEHFTKYAPWDGSRPDPWYKEPPPPPPDRGPDAPDDEPAGPTGRTDGLQDVPTAGPSKPKEEKKQEESVADYKRQGPANGLQRQPAVPDVQLPPITVVPCKTAQCVCDLKGK